MTENLNVLTFPNTTDMEFLDNSCSKPNYTDSLGNTISQPCYICKEKCQFTYINNTLSSSYVGYTGALEYSNVNVKNSLNQTPITFNESKYSIDNMFLLSPSIGKYSTGNICEFVITTRSTFNKLNIFIPVLINDTKEDSFNVSNTALIGATGYNDFKLSDYIPDIPFIFYNASGDYYIVFTTSYLTISSNFKNSLCGSTENCETNPNVSTPAYYKGPLYYNQNGPGEFDDSDQIYINCTPTDHSNNPSEIQNSNNDAKPYTPTASWLDKIWIFYIIVIVVTFLTVYIIIKIILYIFTPLSSKKMSKLLE